jgi:uncharacterized membrane protein YwzB
MVLVLGGFLLIVALSAGLVYGIFTLILKKENPTDALLYWILTGALAVLLAGFYINYITSVTNITFIDK